MIKNVPVLLMAISSILILSSCAKGVVKTVDESVEYKSAKTIPPLKKDKLSSASQSPEIEQVAQVDGITTEIYKDKKDMSRMQINSDYYSAWDFVDRQLKAADVTVYNRNQTAGFFSVNCGDVIDIPEFKKKSAFRILKSKKNATETEYCRIQVTGTRRKKTYVRFLNRYGKVSSGSYVDDLFTRLSSK